MDDSKLIRVRIKGTGQILDLVPHVARARIAGGTAELLEEPAAETAALDPSTEQAVTSAHKPPKKKTTR